MTMERDFFEEFSVIDAIGDWVCSAKIPSFSGRLLPTLRGVNMPHTKRVFDALESNIPWIKERAGDPKSLLYVGWRRDCKPWWHDTFCPKLGIERVGVLEIFPKNLNDLEQEIWAGRYNVTPILGDARKPHLSLKPREWDIIFWDHGPEHVSAEDLEKATQLLKMFAGRLLLYCCPWGDWPQGPEDGNEHEIHRNAVTTEQLTKHGMMVTEFGKIGQAGEGELLGFCFLNEYSFDEFSNRG